MHEVAIVGFGPTGAAAANLLGSLNVKTLVLDRSETIYDKPRAIALDHEIMRVFQQFGIVDEIAPHIAPYPPSVYRGVDGRVIKRLDSAPAPWPMGFPPNLSFTQPPVEAALRSAAQRRESVQVELGVEVAGVVQHEEHAELVLRGPSGEARAQARYVIACDGANSTLRREVGIALEDRDFDEPWLVVDVLVSDAALQGLPDTNVQYCEPQRPATYVVGPANHRRWEIMLQENEDPREILQEIGVWQLLQRWVTPGDARIWRSATYRFHALVAQRWRIGRVFLAGDAAHQQPPFLGQGMCQGVRDAVNLSWKLAAVLNGVAADALLRTYEQERAAHVRALIETIKGLGRFVCERDPEKARRRDEKLIAEMGGTVKTALRQDLMPLLKAGFVSASGHAAVGSLFPQPRLRSSSTLMDEEAGGGFRLIVSCQVLDDDLALLSRRRMPWGPKVVRVCGPAEPVRTTSGSTVQTLHEQDGIVQDWFARQACVAALVRPDHYVFGVATDAAGIAALLDEAASALRAGRESLAAH